MAGAIRLISSVGPLDSRWRLVIRQALHRVERMLMIWLRPTNRLRDNIDDEMLIQTQ